MSNPAAAKPAKKLLINELWFRVLVGLVFGVGFGFFMAGVSADNFLGEDGKTIVTTYVKPIGTVFINLIKMVVVPLIFFSLVAGITAMTDADAFKRIGLKSVMAYLMTGAFAVVIGLFFGHVFEPGVGVDLSSLEAHADATKVIAAPKDVSLIQILVNIIPKNIVKAMATDQILQVVLIFLFNHL